MKKFMKVNNQKIFKVALFILNMENCQAARAQEHAEDYAIAESLARVIERLFPASRGCCPPSTTDLEYRQRLLNGFCPRDMGYFKEHND